MRKINILAGFPALKNPQWTSPFFFGEENDEMRVWNSFEATDVWCGCVFTLCQRPMGPSFTDFPGGCAVSKRSMGFGLPVHHCKTEEECWNKWEIYMGILQAFLSMEFMWCFNLRIKIIQKSTKNRNKIHKWTNLRLAHTFIALISPIDYPTPFPDLRLPYKNKGQLLRRHLSMLCYWWCTGIWHASNFVELVS